MFSLFSVDGAGNKIQGSIFTYLFAPFGRIGLGQQHFRRNMVELRIAVIGIAVCVSELQRFHNFVDVFRGVHAERSEIVSLQNIQRLNHGRPLAPETGLVDLVALEIRGDGFFRLQMECRHVFVPQKSIVGTHEGVDAVRDIAAIEEVPHGVDGYNSAGAACESLFLSGRHGPQGFRQVGLPENLAGHGNLSVRHERFFRIRPQIEEPAHAGDGAGAHFIDRQAVGQFDGRLDFLGKRFCPELPQRNEARVHHARNQCRHDARHWNDAFQSARLHGQDLARPGPSVAEKLCGCQLWHRPHSGDREYFAGFGADQNGRFASHSEMRELSDRGRKHGCDSRVHGVSAVKVDAHAGFGGIFAATRHRAPGPARGVHRGLFEILVLGQAERREAEKENGGLILHTLGSL